MGMIVAEIKSRTKVHKEVCDYPGLQWDRIHPPLWGTGMGPVWGVLFPSPIQTLDSELIGGMKHMLISSQWSRGGGLCGTTEALPSGAWPCGKLRDQILQANPKVPVQQAFHCCLAMAGVAVGAQTSSFLI